MSDLHGAKSERASRIEPLTRLATGGMADIWLSREVGAAGLERLVVVKRLLPHLAREPEIVDMFVSEARIIARLVHPNVVQIHGLGEDDEGYFLVMEYVAGCSVSELLTAAVQTKTSLPLAASLCIAEQACRGAHAAHELCDPTGHPLGLVHRDISPHNLMIGPSGEVKLLDFGIAKATEAAGATRTGTLKGKHGYMSPEQCNVTHLDRRSDVFALGIVCWELLTGKRLFKRDTEYATMHAIVNGEVRPPSAVRADLPKALDDVLLKALAVDLEERFQTADAFRRALTTAAEDNGIRPSRDALVTTMTELLGDRLEERERALHDAAKSGRFPEPLALRAALVQADSSVPGPSTATRDAIATVIQKRAPTHTDDADSSETARTGPGSRGGAAASDEATVIEPRSVPRPIPIEPALESEPEERTDPEGDQAPAPAGEEAKLADEPPPKKQSRVWIGAAVGLAVGAVAGVIALSPMGGGPSSGGETTSSTGQTTSLAATESAAPEPKGPKLRFVIAPTVDQNVIRQEIGPFLGWLGRKLDRPIELTIADSYDDTGVAVAEDRADFGLLPPLLFVRTSAREPRLQPIVVRLFDGSRASDGYVLVLDDSPITQATDLKGRTICYVDRSSTTGFLLPRIWMRKAGLVPDKDVNAVVSGDHIAAMRDLVAGKCEAAAVYSGAYLTARQEGIAVGRMRILTTTGRVPQDAMVASPDLPKDQVAKLREVLLAFEPRRDIDAGSIGKVLGITGFADFQTAEMDAIREAAESEGLIPKGGSTQ